MLQGVSRTARKRHNKAAPNFLQGATSTPQQCLDGSAPTSFIWCQLWIAAMPLEQRTKGRVIGGAQKCQPPRALPTIYRGLLCLRRNAITSPPSTGAISASRQRYFSRAPNFLQGVKMRAQKCRVPTTLKGRAVPWSQKCHMRLALPNQFNGVIVKTQKCRDIVAPRGRVMDWPQKCHTTYTLPKQSQGTLT